ncbi:MAG: DUF4105 domain-containing protein [Polyangiaceae bacterium]
MVGASLVVSFAAQRSARAERNPIAFNASGFDPDKAQFSLLAVSLGTESVDMLAGHVMVRVKQDDLDYTFDWGNYNAKKSGFVINYIKGDISFEHQVRPIASTIKSYKKENRQVLEYPLQLTREQKARVLATFVEWAKPERRVYHYDFALENCSTAIRDILGTAIGPQFKAFYERPAQQTYRSIGMPYFYNFPVVLPLAELGLGAPTDRALQNWDLFFLPLVGFEQYRASPAYDDGGNPMPDSHLLGEPTVLNPGQHAEIGKVRWSMLYGALLSLLALGGTGLRYLRRTDPLAAPYKVGTYALGGALMVTGWFFGLLSMLFIAIWTATAHRLAFQNYNLAFLWPTDLALVAIAWRLIRHDRYASQPQTSRALVGYFGLHLAVGTLVALGSLVSVVPQDVRVASLLSLPLWLALFVDSLTRLTQAAPARPNPPAFDPESQVQSPST